MRPKTITLLSSALLLATSAAFAQNTGAIAGTGTSASTGDTGTSGYNCHASDSSGANIANPNCSGNNRPHASNKTARTAGSSGGSTEKKKKPGDVVIGEGAPSAGSPQ